MSAKGWIREHLTVTDIDGAEMVVCEHSEGHREYHPVDSLADEYGDAILDDGNDPEQEAIDRGLGHERFF